MTYRSHKKTTSRRRSKETSEKINIYRGNAFIPVAILLFFAMHYGLSEAGNHLGSVFFILAIVCGLFLVIRNWTFHGMTQKIPLFTLSKLGLEYFPLRAESRHIYWHNIQYILIDHDNRCLCLQLQLRLTSGETLCFYFAEFAYSAKNVVQSFQKFCEVRVARRAEKCINIGFTRRLLRRIWCTRDCRASTAVIRNLIG